MIDPTPYRVRWRLTDPAPLKTQGHAHVWSVRQADGQPAALKIFARDDWGNERHAALWYRAYAGGGIAPQVLAEDGNALLLDWVEGAPLGDLFRAGHPDLADRHLAETLRRLHQSPPPVAGPFVSLDAYTDALQKVRCPDGVDPALFANAKDMHRALFASAPPAVLLHGDLHHDNVIGAGQTWQAIDPKAIVGDPHFEPANAFRNPTGGEALAADPARIHTRAALWSEAMGLDRGRLLHWAAVKCALSIAWSCGRDGARPVQPEDAVLLPILLEIALAQTSPAP